MTSLAWISAGAGGGGGSVAFDDDISQSTVDEDFNSTASVSHTAVVGSDVAALVFAVTQFGSGVTGVTYGGAAMTQIGSTFAAVAGNDISVSAWIKTNPATGAQTVEATDPGEPTKFYLVAMSFTGVHQTVPSSGLFTASAGSGTATVDATSVDADDLVVDLVANWGDGPTVGAGQTKRGTTVDVGGTQIAQSTEAGSGSVTMSWGTGTTDGWGSIAVALKPA